MKRLAVAVVAVLLGVAGAVGLVRADAGLSRRSVGTPGGGVPVEVVQPSDVEGRLPGVLVVHGFAGSGRLMRGFGDTLARRGYVVALLDVTGHGANPRALPQEPEARDRTLQRDLAGAVALLKSLSTVDPERVGLVGHSMGAGAVVAYAAGDPTIRATVAVSLGAEDFGTPRDLLIIYGGLEFSGFRDAADAALRTGAAERVVEVPGVEHISVLFATRTHEETARHLGATLAGGDGGVRPRARLLPGGLLLLAFILGLYPLAALLPGRDPTRVTPSAWWWPPVGVVVAVVGARLFDGLPLAVGGYTAGYFLLFGLVLLVARRERPPMTPETRWSGLLVLYAVPAVLVPVHASFTHALPVGARWWLLPVVALCCWVFLFGAELAAGGHVGRHALMLTLAAGGLLGGALVGVAPGFVVLVVPLLIALLAWQAIWAVVLRGRGAPAWLIAAVGAVVLAWPVATTLPLAA